MNKKTFFLGLCVLGLILALTLNIGLAHSISERKQPVETSVIDAVVNSKFTYQGYLHEDGTPVTGMRNLDFQLYSDDACTTMVGSLISLPGVLINEGLFSVELSVSPTEISGLGLWMGIEVNGANVGCQEIMPVPYALSLRPGARIEGPQEGWDALHVENTAVGGQSYGLYARTDSPNGRGVYAYASASSGVNYGLFARSNSVSGAGILARGLDSGADLILAGNASTVTGDDGRISSDPNYPSSDIVLLSNDTIRIDLDEDGDGEDADFEIRNGDNTLIFNVDESGDVSFGGSGMTAFPRPAYDSGWVSLSQGASTTLSHNLSGNRDNYVIDLTCNRTGGAGVNNWGVGGDAGATGYYGGWWSNLTTTDITIHRWDDDTDCPNLRVRIWIYS